MIAETLIEPEVVRDLDHPTYIRMDICKSEKLTGSHPIYLKKGRYMFRKTPQKVNIYLPKP
jgi:hypothetical protein